MGTLASIARVYWKSDSYLRVLLPQECTLILLAFNRFSGIGRCWQERPLLPMIPSTTRGKPTALLLDRSTPQAVLRVSFGHTMRRFLILRQIRITVSLLTAPRNNAASARLIRRRYWSSQGRPRRSRHWQ